MLRRGIAPHISQPRIRFARAHVPAAKGSVTAAPGAPQKWTRTDILTLLGVIVGFVGVVAAGVIAVATIMITNTVDEANARAASIQSCTSSALATLADLSELKSGFAVSPYDKSARLHDWNLAHDALATMSVICKSTLSESPGEQAALATLMSAHGAEYKEAGGGKWSPGTTDKLIRLLSEFIASEAGST